MAGNRGALSLCAPFLAFLAPSSPPSLQRLPKLLSSACQNSFHQFVLISSICSTQAHSLVLTLPPPFFYSCIYICERCEPGLLCKQATLSTAAGGCMFHKCCVPVRGITLFVSRAPVCYLPSPKPFPCIPLRAASPSLQFAVVRERS